MMCALSTATQAEVVPITLKGQNVKLAVPDGWCAIQRQDIEIEGFELLFPDSLKRYRLLAYVTACSMLDNGKLTRLPELWGAWVVGREELPPAMTRQDMMANLGRLFAEERNVQLEGPDASMDAGVASAGDDDHAAYLRFEGTIDVWGDKTDVTATDEDSGGLRTKGFAGMLALYNHALSLTLHKAADLNVDLETPVKNAMAATMRQY